MTTGTLKQSTPQFPQFSVPYFSDGVLKCAAFTYRGQKFFQYNSKDISKHPVVRFSFLDKIKQLNPTMLIETCSKGTEMDGHYVTNAPAPRFERHDKPGATIFPSLDTDVSRCSIRNV